MDDRFDSTKECKVMEVQDLRRVMPSPGVCMVSKGLSKSGGFYQGRPSMLGGSRYESSAEVEPAFRKFTSSQLVISDKQSPPMERDFEETRDIGFDVNKSRHQIRANDFCAHRLLVTEQKQYGFQTTQQQQPCRQEPSSRKRQRKPFYPAGSVSTADASKLRSQ